MKKTDVVALGELLIDFTMNGESSQGNPLMEANPGGAPCNVLSMLTKLGHSTDFIGKVGKDMFGEQLKNAVDEVGIGTTGLIMDPEALTTLAFVKTYPDGDRDFSFYRKPGADMQLRADEIPEDLLKNCRIFHYGSLSMTDEECEGATRKAMDIAGASGALLSFDPNLREPLWESLDKAKEKIAYGMSKADILKISDNEITWFTGEEDYEAGVKKLREICPNLKLILVSLGPEGSMAFSNRAKACVKPFLNPNTIETTGAGDTFCACVLHYVLEHDGLDYEEEQLTEMLTFANAAASLITTRKGALRVMPDRSEIEEMIKG